MKLYDVIRKEELERFEKKKDINIDRKETNYSRSDRNDDFGHKRSSPYRKIFILVIIAIFIMSVYLIGIRLVHAKVTITPREIPFSADKIKIELLGDTSGNDKLTSFQAMVVNGEVSREVFGGDLKTSTTRAKGRVVFSNDYTKVAQVIKAKTTLIGTNGKKYQTDANVTVPGYTVKKDGTKVTGTSPQVAITALDVGPSFNADSGMTLTISGYTSAKSKQFYATAPVAITGGENGTVYVVSDKDKASVLATLQTQLTEKLKRESRTQVPAGFVAFPELQFITVNNDSAVLKGNTVKFPASIKGTMVSYLIPRNLLEIAIADKVLSDKKYGGVTIPNILDLDVTPITAIPTDPKSTPDAITISVSGNGKVITKIPTDIIKDSLLGIQKEAFSSKLANIYEIDEAKYNLYPFWAPYFPHDLSSIEVEVK
jgi:hypothetical protein